MISFNALWANEYNIVNGRRIPKGLSVFVTRYRYEPYALIIDRSSGRPIPRYVFTVITWRENINGKKLA